MGIASRAWTASAAAQTTLVVIVIGGIGWIDYVTGPDLSFSLIYLVPIAVAAWWGSRLAAWAAVVASTAVWFGADVAWFPNGHLLIAVWNGVNRCIIFSGSVVAIRHVRRTRDRERVEAIAALRASEAKFRGLVESTSDWVWEIDEHERYTYCSPKSYELLGYRPGELIGRHPSELMPPPEAERVRHSFGELIARHQPLARLENVNLHRDGREVVLETSAVPVFDAAGEFRGYRGIDRDVTERKAAERERSRLTARLNEAQRIEAIGRLAGGVAHDFNNLLTVIRGSADFLMESLGSGDSGRADAEEIRKAADRARQLTWQLLAFGRRQILEPRPIDLNAIVSGMDGLLRRLVREDIQLEIVPVPGVAAVNADPTQVEQVITNLAANACDAMPNGGTLTIRTGFADLAAADLLPSTSLQPGPYVTLAVCDTGVGMDEASQAHAFEPFFTTKDRFQGTGLGLATVRGIVEQSGGQVQVQSAPGEGSTFTIYLPRLDQTAIVPIPRAVRAARAVPSGLETILIAEDEENVRLLLARFLKLSGYTVLVAADPQEALVVAADSAARIDLLVTDVVMPGMSGPVLASRIADVRPGIKVLYVSGYPDTALAHQGVFEPGAAFLQKPFSRDTLVQKIRETLGQ